MWDRMEPGFARKGVAFRQTTASNATNCAVMCDFTVEGASQHASPSVYNPSTSLGCVAINYRSSDRACFFLADPGYIYSSPGYTTALVKSSGKTTINLLGFWVL